MTCIRMSPSAIVCVNDWGRLKVGNRYVWVDMHPYFGPTFFADSAMTKLYDPVDEGDPVWPAFAAWHEKKVAEKAKQANTKEPNHG